MTATIVRCSQCATALPTTCPTCGPEIPLKISREVWYDGAGHKKSDVVGDCDGCRQRFDHRCKEGEGWIERR